MYHAGRDHSVVGGQFCLATRSQTRPSRLRPPTSYLERKEGDGVGDIKVMGEGGMIEMVMMSMSPGSHNPVGVTVT